MSGLGKKILSAFVEVTEQKDQPTPRPAAAAAPVSVSGDHAPSLPAEPEKPGGDRFQEYFEKLFSDSNIPGPDYYEFCKMTEAMQAIPDERSRFLAAFAGLQVQGLDRNRLLSTADQYLQVLNTDASQFRTTAGNALEEKVNSKKKEAEEKSQRIQDLSREITGLQQEIIALQDSIRDNEAKIAASSAGYESASRERLSRIQADIEKIKQYIS